MATIFTIVLEKALRAVYKVYPTHKDINTFGKVHNLPLYNLSSQNKNFAKKDL